MTIYRHQHAPGVTEAGCEGCIAQDIDTPRPPTLLRKAIAFVRLDMAVCKVRGHRVRDSQVTGWDWCVRCQTPQRQYPPATAAELRAALVNILIEVRQSVPDLEEPHQHRLKLFHDEGRSVIAKH